MSKILENGEMRFLYGDLPARTPEGQPEGLALLERIYRISRCMYSGVLIRNYAAGKGGCRDHRTNGVKWRCADAFCTSLVGGCYLHTLHITFADSTAISKHNVAHSQSKNMENPGVTLKHCEHSCLQHCDFLTKDRKESACT